MHTYRDKTKTVKLHLDQYRYIWTPQAADPIIAFAAGELVHFWKAMKLPDLQITVLQPSAKRCILLKIASAGRNGLTKQAYRIARVADRVEILGGDGRGVLYGVYVFLEQLGIRFFGPGNEGVCLPVRRTSIRMVSLPATGRPRFARRSLSELLPMDLLPKPKTICQVLDWLARLRLNVVHFWFHYYEETILAQEPNFMKEASRRGIEIELGGHEFETLLLPRSLFTDHPDWFPSPSGGAGSLRSPDHNACASSIGARRTMEKNAFRLARKYPGVRVFHFWPTDMEGHWCRCPACKHLTLSDQSLLCMNAAARGVRRADRRNQAVFIGYRGTDYAPATVKPEHNVIFMAAPLPRCYGHSLSASKCPRNAFYRKAIITQVALFPRDSGTFEYYSCGQVLRNLAPPLLGLIAEDFSFYHQIAGLQVVRVLVSNYRPLAWVEMLNLIAFSRLAYDANADAAEIRCDYAQAVFGPRGTELERILKRWEEILRRALRHCVHAEQIVADTRWPTGSSGPFGRRQIKDTGQAVRDFEKVIRALASIPGQGLAPFGKKRLMDLKTLARLTRLELALLHHQVCGQNERLSYLADGRIGHLTRAHRHLAEGARLAGAENMQAQRTRLTDTDSYRMIQNAHSKEFAFLAKGCEEEMSAAKQKSAE